MPNTKVLFLSFALLLFAACPALAEIEVTPGNPPEEPKLETDPGGQYLNIYERQVEYGDKDKQFHSMLEKRRAAFGAPNVTVEREYRETIRKRHGFPAKSGSESENEESISGETYGPPDPSHP